MSYNWTIGAMDYAVEQDDLDNVVTVVHWRVSKSDDDGNSGSCIGTQSLQAPDADNFTAWADIDEATAIEWCKAEMGEEQVANIEASIDAQIAEKATPTRGTGVPW